MHHTEEELLPSTTRHSPGTAAGTRHSQKEIKGINLPTKRRNSNGYYRRFLKIKRILGTIIYANRLDNQIDKFLETYSPYNKTESGRNR